VWRIIITAIAVLFVAALPWILASPHWIGQFSEMAFIAFLIGSINLSRGYAGQLSLGQAAICAVAAYTVAFFSIHVSSSVFVTMPAGVIAALLVGAIIGIPALRLNSWTLASATFFAVIVLPNVVNLTPAITGGINGLSGIPAPSLFGWSLDQNWIFFLTIVLFALWTWGITNFVHSRHGDALKTMRKSELLTRSIGISNFQLKLMVYLLASIPIGIAGALFIYRFQFVSASPFSFPLVVGVMAGSQLGGAMSPWGALVGAVILQLGPAQSSEFRQASLLIYGILMLVVGLALPNGLTGVAENWYRKVRAHKNVDTVNDVPQTTPTRIPLPNDAAVGAYVAELFATRGRKGEKLEVRGVSKAFGGVRALDDVSLDAEPGRITGLIGANGSGKTTLLNIISGYLIAEDGKVSLGGEPLKGKSPTVLARAGVRRTFQTPIIPETMTTTEAVAIARYELEPLGIIPAVLQSAKFRQVAAADREAALEALGACDLDAYADREASSLPLGLRRLVEVARVIAGAPRIVLLDEPAAGLEEREIADLLNVVRALRNAGMTVILIEHNFNVIRAVADVVYVLDRGRLIAQGEVDQIATDPAVIESYFGGHAPIATTSAPLTGPYA